MFDCADVQFAVAIDPAIPAMLSYDAKRVQQLLQNLVHVRLCAAFFFLLISFVVVFLMLVSTICLANVGLCVFCYVLPCVARGDEIGICFVALQNATKSTPRSGTVSSFSFRFVHMFFSSLHHCLPLDTTPDFAVGVVGNRSDGGRAQKPECGECAVLCCFVISPLPFSIIIVALCSTACHFATLRLVLGCRLANLC